MDTQSPDINVDELLSSIESASPERPMSQDEAAPPEATPEQAEPVWNGTEWEFEWNGKKIAPESRDKAKTWMSQGYNYSHRVGELNKQQKEWETKLKDYETKVQGLSKYSQVDEYASQNKEWWAHVEDAWSKRGQFQPNIDPALAPILSPIQEKISFLEQFARQYQQDKQLQQQERELKEQREEDQALDAEIETIRKSHPNIDFGQVDPLSGETLELQVLKHAQKIGSRSFQAAFRDLLHDKLVELAKAEGREAIAKDTKQAARKGILGQTPAPTKGLAPAGNVRGKSWDDLSREALAELGINQ